MKNLVNAESYNSKNIIDTAVVKRCQKHLKQDGWVLLRGFDADLNCFSSFVSHFCSKLTFDPAREFSDESIQKVDAGTAAIGLHIENGNTPFPPDIVGFYSSKSAQTGSQTTVCDGHAFYQAFNHELKQKLCQRITVSRTLPEQLWKRYAVSEHPDLNNIDEVDASHLDQILAISPNHRGRLNDDGSLFYELDISPILDSKFSGKTAFANAILGPSFNYEPPKYQFSDGSTISENLKQQLANLAEAFTQEIAWQDGDIALIDNTRVMHGRRKITDDSNRELYISMGMI